VPKRVPQQRIRAEGPWDEQHEAGKAAAREERKERRRRLSAEEGSHAERPQGRLPDLDVPAAGKIPSQLCMVKFAICNM